MISLPMRRGLWRTIGVTICVAAAFFLAFTLRSSSGKTLVPYFFLGIIGIVALEFGNWAAIAGTILSALILAVFLYEPLYSLQVNGFHQRLNLVAMAVLGIALSELLGVPERAPRFPSKRTPSHHDPGV